MEVGGSAFQVHRGGLVRPYVGEVWGVQGGGLGDYGNGLVSLYLVEE